MKRIITLIAVVLGLAACGSSAPHHQAAKPKPTHTAAAAPSSPSCQDQLTAWRTGGGLADTQAVGKGSETTTADQNQLVSDLKANADTTADTIKMSTDLGTFSGAIQVLKNNLPPKCVPHFAADLSSALDSYQTANSYQTRMVGDVQNNDFESAITDISQANAAESQANAELSVAVKDLSTFTGT